MRKITSIIAFAVLAIGAIASGAPRAVSETSPPISIVLVHGAFADGSSWNEIIPILQAEGLNVVAVQNPLTSLADDVAAARRAMALQKGPIVLVGYSWGGTVITEAGDDDRVKALVYVAAFAPSPGEKTSDLGKNYSMPAGLANPVLDASGFLTLSPDTVAQHFAQDVPPEQARLIAATQGPIRAASFDEAVTTAAWQTKPSWYIVAEQDHMIDPRLEMEFAKKIKADVTSLPTSHVPMISRPQEVAAVILEAAESIR